MEISLEGFHALQPELYSPGNNILTVAVASLALGGAEKIILDWASRVYPRWQVEIIIFRNQPKEWPVPDFIRTVRFNGKHVIGKLGEIGKSLAASQLPVCLCHLLVEKEREALAKAGVFVVPVLHNARAGWLEDITSLERSNYAIAVSDACAKDLYEGGWKGYTSVIHQLPAPKKFIPGLREKFRAEWRIPLDATLIGMIGAVKPQKDYGFALRLLKILLERRDVYLAIIGGPIGKKGRETWDTVVREIHDLDLRHRVTMPGFIPDAVQCLPALDMVLNTSHYEGLSMATLEALVNKKPVVASLVGGQGEVGGEGLRLVPKDAPLDSWAEAVEQALASEVHAPSWSGFPAHRLWTLAQLARPVEKKGRVLFVTANLNSGGAQRSLVNLACALKGRLKFEIAVAGNSTAPYFFRQLRSAGIKVFRSAESKDAFDHAEMLVKKICDEGFGTVCFWNLDPKIKLLLLKTLHFAGIRFIDVSPGNNSFEELHGNSDFQRLISFRVQQYYERLDKLVLKYKGIYPSGCGSKVEAISNGISPPKQAKINYAIVGSPKVVVNGRIAPAKFLVEIISAMKILWNSIPDAELHVFGAAEPRFKEYAEQVKESAEGESGRRIFFHGLDFEVPEKLREFDAYLVLGKDQGCPNALLEALAAGLPAVGNDEGGTAEQLIHGETGLLVKGYDPEDIAAALERIITDRELAERLGKAGRAHVLQVFSMEKMADRYLRLFEEDSAVGRIRMPAAAQTVKSAFRRIKEFVRGKIGIGEKESEIPERISHPA